MSRKFQNKNKDLVNLEVVPAKKVWKKNKKNEFILDDNYQYFGKVEKGQSAFIVETNKKGQNPRFIEDTCKLTKKSKSEIVKQFNNTNTKVVYLVKKKNK